MWRLVFRSSPPVCISLCLTLPLRWFDYDSCVCSTILCCSLCILCVPSPVPCGYLVHSKFLHFSSVLSLILFWLLFYFIFIPAFCWLHFDFWEISASLIKLPFYFITCLPQCLEFGSFSKKTKTKNEQIYCTFSKHITFQWLDIQYRVVSDTDYDFFQMAW